VVHTPSRPSLSFSLFRRPVRCVAGSAPCALAQAQRQRQPAGASQPACLPACAAAPAGGAAVRCCCCRPLQLCKRTQILQRALCSAPALNTDRSDPSSAPTAPHTTPPPQLTLRCPCACCMPDTGAICMIADDDTSTSSRSRAASDTSTNLETTTSIGVPSISTSLATEARALGAVVLCLSSFFVVEQSGLEEEMMLSGHGGGRRLFTASQWQELEHQALIFKYMASGAPVPHDLVLPLRLATGVDTAPSLAFPPQPSPSRTPPRASLLPPPSSSSRARVLHSSSIDSRRR
jgi:hypothetical protein